MSVSSKVGTLLSVTAVLSTLAVMAPSPVSAQSTFTACRVPTVGAIYMIGLEGLPTECLDPSHVEFSWTESGSVADGSVTTAKLADAAVVSAKIADDAVTGSAIAPDAIDSLSILNGSILGEDLRSGTVRSLQIGDRSITGTDVGFGALVAENFASGAAGALVQDVVGNTGLLSTTATEIGNIEYTAPAEGRALIIVTGSAYLGGEDTHVRVGIGGSPGSTSTAEVSVGYANGTGTSDVYLPFTAMGVVPIAVGGISRYYVSAWVDPGSDLNTASLVGVRTVLIYVPDGM